MTAEAAEDSLRPVAWSFYLAFLGPCISILGVAGLGDVVTGVGLGMVTLGALSALVFAMRDSRRRHRPLARSLWQGLRRGFCSFIDLF